MKLAVLAVAITQVQADNHETAAAAAPALTQAQQDALDAIANENAVGGAIGGVLGVITGLTVWYLPLRKYLDERKVAIYLNFLLKRNFRENKQSEMYLILHTTLLLCL